MITIISDGQRLSNQAPVPGPRGPTPPEPDVTKGTAAKWGVPLSETGINISRFVVRYYPEVDVTFPNIVGNTAWRAVSQKLSRTVECEGEIKDGTGIMAFTVGVVTAFANKTNYFPTEIGGSLFLDEATVTASRKGWLTVNVKATARGSL